MTQLTERRVSSTNCLTLDLMALMIGAGMATLLWLPAAYLQCSALALGLLLAWAAGAMAGISGGFWFGVGSETAGDGYRALTDRL